MATGTVHLRGYREMIRALNKIDRSVGKVVTDELKQVADPVVQDIQAKEAQWVGSSPGTIGPKVKGKGIFITQRKRKVTGLRGDFGALQMEQAFLPSLEENEDEIRRGVENALDRLTRSAGF